MGKDMKIKHSVSSLSPPPAYKIYGNSFCKNALHGGTNVLGQIYGGMFYMGTNNQIVQVGKLMVKRFKMSSEVSFPLIDCDLGY